MTHSRLTVEIPEDLHKQLKRQALDEGKTLKEVIRESLAKHLKC